MNVTATRVELEASPDRGVAAELQRTLVELIDLSLVAKQAHWNVSGPLFRSLHQHFDDIAESARDWADLVAERLEAINAPADGRVATVADGSALPPMPEGELDGQTAVVLVTERVGDVARRVRERVQTIGDADLLSQDVLIEVGRGLEKQFWMLREQVA